MPNHGIYESYIPRPWNIRIVYSTTMEYTIYLIELLYGRYVIYSRYSMLFHEYTIYSPEVGNIHRGDAEVNIIKPRVNK